MFFVYVKDYFMFLDIEFNRISLNLINYLYQLIWPTQII